MSRNIHGTFDPRSAAPTRAKPIRPLKLAALVFGISVAAFVIASVVQMLLFGSDVTPPGLLDGIEPIADPMKLPDDVGDGFTSASPAGEIRLLDGAPVPQPPQR